MSQQPYVIKGVVSDDDFLSPSIGGYYERHYVRVTFFSDEYQTPVTPTGGTCTITATDDGFNFGTVTSGTINVTRPTYDRPNFAGRVQKVKATLSGVTGATHFIAVIDSYN